MFIRLFGFALISTFLISCSGENQPYFSKPKVTMKGANCLATTLSKFDDYFQGNVTDQEIHAFWDCVETTWTSVERYMEGSESNGNYKSQDVREFVGKYFLKSNEPGGIKINDILLDEVMEVKRLFLGGSRLILTKEEITKARRLFKEFRTMSVQLNPSMRLIFKNKNGQTPEDDEIIHAIGNLSGVFEKVGELLSIEQNAYSIDRFVRLVTELHNVLGKSGPDVPFLKYVPAFKELKFIFLLTAKDQIESIEWPILSRLIGQGFSVYFRYRYFFGLKSLVNPSTVGEVPKALDGIHAILNEALQRRENRAFTTEEFTAVINELEKNNLLPIALPKKDIIRVWSVVVDRLLSPERPIENGLGEDELNYAKSTWNGWLVSQKYLLGMNVDQSHPSVVQLKKFLELPWAFKLDKEERLVFENPDPGASDLASSTDINWMRTLFTLVARGYGTGGKLTVEQLKVTIQDIEPILIYVGLIAKASPTFHSTLFLQSNLFLPRSNGDEFIDLFEVTEFVLYALKGLHASNLFLAKLKDHCDTTGTAVDVECFRGGFKFFFGDRVAHLPHLVKFSETFQKEKEWKSFIGDFESATRPKEIPYENPITKSDINEIYVLMQFIETVMFRFDKDMSGTLNLDEILVAFPLFQSRLSKLSGIDDPDELKVLFTYICRYGEAPDVKNPISLLRYLHWRLNKKIWKKELSTDRGTIVKILSSITNASTMKILQNP